MEPNRDSRTAPFHAIPPRRLVSVEHPAVVRNLDRAMDTLQGNAGIEKVSPPKKIFQEIRVIMLTKLDPKSTA